MNLPTPRMKNYLTNKTRTRFAVNGTEVKIKDQLSSDFDAKTAILNAFELLPKRLYRGLKVINIGQYDFLKDRDLKAVYKNKQIFVTNKQTSPSDLVDDIVHEIAHMVEEENSEIIYGDNEIEREFLSKRKELWIKLKNKGYPVSAKNFLNIHYVESFDMFLYKKIGYPVLSAMSSSLFYSPYSVTSLREYFASGFEAFFMKEEIYKLKKISPKLYEKITTLLTEKQNNKTTKGKMT